MNLENVVIYIFLKIHTSAKFLSAHVCKVCSYVKMQCTILILKMVKLSVERWTRRTLSERSTGDIAGVV